MGFTEPDTPPPPGGVPQMPQASMPGIAPVPYTGPDEAPEPPVYAVPAFGDANGATVMVMDATPGHEPEAPQRGPVAPYEPGTVSPVYAGDVAGPRGDTVASDPAGAVANAEARFHAHEGGTLVQGGTLGDLMDLPMPAPGNFGGAFYDPPRDYGAH